MNDKNESDQFLEELRQDFLDEVSFLLDDCEESFLKLEFSKNKDKELSQIFRLVHSIKGTGMSVGLIDLAEFSHSLEDCLAILRVKPHLVDDYVTTLLLRGGDALKTRVKMLREDSDEVWDCSQLQSEIESMTQTLSGKSLLETTKTTINDDPKKLQDGLKDSLNDNGQKKRRANYIKVDSERIEAVLNLVGELIVLKGQLLQNNSLTAGDDPVLALLERTVVDLYDKTLNMRMTSLKQLLLKMQRIVRDLSIDLKKPINFIMEGENTEIDRTMIEFLNDPLVHIVRNCVDHGIESAEERKNYGKATQATVSIKARQEGSRVIIDIHDDGKGIDRDKILEKALAQKIIASQEEAQAMSDSEIYKLIFAPGFSTAETVTNVSGRGVGLDVVKNNIERLRGNIEISSTPNEETLFRISLPLTTAISEGIIVFVDGHRFIFPIYQIEGFTQLNPSTVTTITKDREVVQIRDEFIPLIRMGSVTTQIRNKIKGTTLDQKAESRTINTRIENKTIVIVECKGKKYALMVDSLGGQTQVVVKSLGDKFKAINLVTGGAIMGDGRVSLVLNITGIIDLYIREYQPNNANKGNFKKIEMVA